MTKTKKFAAFLLAATVATVGISALAACGDEDKKPAGGETDVTGTYTISFTKTELSGNIRHTGFLTSGNVIETNTVTLKNDKTYEYTKYITTEAASATAYVAPQAVTLADEADENVLFSFASAGDGKCTFDCYKDGTYKFVYTTYGMTETGNWTWNDWTFKIKQSNDNEITATQDDSHALNFTYTAVSSAQLTHPFACSAAVWGAAFGGQGTYTPVEGGGETENPGTEDPETPPATSAPVKITYKFTGTYTNDGTTVTLNAATACTWSEDWGMFAAAGYFTSCSGSTNDKVLPKGETGEWYLPLDHFGGKYYFAENSATEVTNNTAFKVTVNKNDNTFVYVEESAFD